MKAIEKKAKGIMTGSIAPLVIANEVRRARPPVIIQ
jgi:hypothetical protein